MNVQVTAPVEMWFALGTATHEYAISVDLDDAITEAAWGLLDDTTALTWPVTIALPLALLPALGEAAEIVRANPSSYALRGEE
jgi:hypothetical protein